MNTQTIVWIILAAVIIGGIWLILATPADNTATGSETETATSSTSGGVGQTPQGFASPPTVQTSTTTTGVGSLNYLLSLKTPLVCSVKTKTGITRSGTLYVAGGMARVNFSNSTMINDGTSLYAWRTGATSGTKLPASVGASGSSIATKGGVDPSANLSYLCGPWQADARLFIPPTGVTF